MKFTLLCIISMLIASPCAANPFPIQFAIPETKIIDHIPSKSTDFAHLIPGNLSTYIYTDEGSYYKSYQEAYFAFTWKKGGWDCMRHYEILANGCIPYFVDLEYCPELTMPWFPKKLVLEAMNLPGVSRGHIDHAIFDKIRYFELLEQLLEYTRAYLTTQFLASYVLEAMGYKGTGKILYLSQDPSPDYLRCTLLIGLKELLGERVVDFPKIEHIYKSYPHDVRTLYGKGFSYSKIINDIHTNRGSIHQRINNKEFDIVIYGSVHRGLQYHTNVTAHYAQDQIAYICGEDAHRCAYGRYHNLFIREYDAL